MINDGDVSERVAVLVNVNRRARREAAKHEDGDYQIDETLLNNPPIKGKMTGLIPNHWLIDLGKGSNRVGTRCESNPGSNTTDSGI